MDITTTTTLKHENLREQLLETISTLPQGSRMPTVKTIMNQYSVSQSTVDKALGYLKAEGHIETAPGKGITIKDRRKSQGQASLKNVDLVFFGTRDSADVHTFHSDLIEQLSHILGEKKVWLRSTILAHRATTAQIISHIDSLTGDGLLLVNIYNSEIFNIVSRRNTPFLLITPNCPIDVTNSILVENHSIVRNWIKHLADLGHRNIAYLHSANENLYQRDQYQRLQFYYEELGRAGIPANPEIVNYGGFTRQDGYDATKKLLKQKGKFSAIICGDGIAGGVYSALMEENIVIGRDISVIGVDDASWTSHMQPPLTTVRISRRKLAELAISKLEEQTQNPERSFAKIYIKPELVIRQSTDIPAVD